MALNVPPGTAWKGWDPAAYAAGAAPNNFIQGGGSPTGPAFGPSGTGAPAGANTITTPEAVGAPGQNIAQAIGSISDLGVTGTNMFAPNANANYLGEASAGIPSAVQAAGVLYAGQPEVQGGGSSGLGTAAGPQATPTPGYQNPYVPNTTPSTEPVQTPGPLAALSGGPSVGMGGYGYPPMMLQAMPAGGFGVGPSPGTEGHQMWLWENRGGGGDGGGR